MAIQIDGVDKRIGLGLSGGGFRAAAFHLGVFERLQALGLLDKIDVLSCVSGGSIAGGFLAAEWGKPDTLERLGTYLRTKSVAVASVLGGLIDPFHTRLEKLAQTYADDLFGPRTLQTLSGCPRTYINATNLATGNLFFFVGGGGLPPEAGEHEIGVVPAPGVAISLAVAASSAFPPVFPPLRLEANVYPPAREVEFVTLTDGGVYDNMGVNPLLLKRSGLDYMIVSDGGMPFAIDDRPTESGALVLKASIDIMMEQIRGLEFDRMQHRFAAGAGPRPLWFSIDSTNGENQPGDAALASAIRTNLTALSDAEMTVLRRHGASLVEARIRQFAPKLI